MDMDVEAKRAAISKVYNTDTWHEKVKNMSDRQVIAIFLKFQAEKKF